METTTAFENAFHIFVMDMIEMTGGGSRTTYQEANVIQSAAQVVAEMFDDAGSQRAYLTRLGLRETEVNAAMTWIFEFNRMTRGEVHGVEPLWDMLGITPPAGAVRYV